MPSRNLSLMKDDINMASYICLNVCAYNWRDHKQEDLNLHALGNGRLKGK